MEESKPKIHMQTKLPFIACLCILTACNPSSPDRIQVTGQASMKVVPDMVELSLKAFNVRPAMKDAVKETANLPLTRSWKYVTNISMMMKDIKVSNVSTNKDYDYSGNRQVFKGYSAQQILEVRLKDIRQIEQFTEALLATKISSIENIRYNHSKADSIQRAVNLMALADAKKTAEQMCGKMNVGLGRIVYLSNYSPVGEQMSTIQSGGNDYELNLYSKSFGGRGFKMTSEILDFHDVAFAGFEIKQ